MDINTAFKLFDIRGKYPEVVDERLAYLVSFALSEAFSPKKVLLASDARPSSPKLLRFLVDGFKRGTEVVAMGVVSTPEFYFAASGFDLGVIVTASHLTEFDNGFKIVGPHGLPFDEGQISTLKNLVLKNQKVPPVVPSRPFEQVNFDEAYEAAVLSLFGQINSSLVLACDFNHSSAAPHIKSVFDTLGLNYTELPPRASSLNPLLPTSQVDLEMSVLETKADLGLIWDSDGDRVVFLDSSGKLIPPSFVIGLLGRFEVSRSPKKKVAVDIRAGLIVRDLVVSVGGSLVVEPAWHQFLQFAFAKDPEIVFGGETSGHLFFSDFGARDDGLVGALKFITCLEDPDTRLLLETLRRRYFEIPETNFPCPPDSASLVLEKLTDYYRSKGFEVSIIDGLTVQGDTWRFNLRQSVTEAYLRLNLEADRESVARIIRSEIETLLEEELRS